MATGLDKWSGERMANDGRHIDPALGTLAGEASHQQGPIPPAPYETWHVVPSQLYEDPTYYDKPLLKQPVWVWTIPAYFYVGGVAGAAMVMGMAAQVAGGPRLRRFEEMCRWMGAVGGGIGTALLIYDLGYRRRFLYMLRVFRPTSPMSVGSWVLAGATPLSAGSALLTMSRGWLHFVGNMAGLGAGALGLPLASYTAVLLSNTAVPLWQECRRTLPVLFTASSMAGLGSLCDLLPLGERERRITHRFGTVGRIAELAAGVAVERSAARVPHVARPLHNGVSGALWTAAKLLTGASLGLALAGSRKPAGVLGTLGALALRFAVFHAGKASARDPRATFRQQRHPLPQPQTVEELVNA